MKIQTIKTLASILTTTILTSGICLAQQKPMPAQPPGGTSPVPQLPATPAPQLPGTTPPLQPDMPPPQLPGTTPPLQPNLPPPQSPGSPQPPLMPQTPPQQPMPGWTNPPPTR